MVHHCIAWKMCRTNSISPAPHGMSPLPVQYLQLLPHRWITVRILAPWRIRCRVSLPCCCADWSQKSRMNPLTALTKDRLMPCIQLASCPFLHRCSHLHGEEKLERTFVKICFLSQTKLNHKSLESAHPDKGSAAGRNESVRQLVTPWMSPVLQPAAGTSSSDWPLSCVNERYCVQWLLVTEFNTNASNLIPAAHGPTVTRLGADRPGWQLSTSSF